MALMSEDRLTLMKMSDGFRVHILAESEERCQCQDTYTVKRCVYPTTTLSIWTLDERSGGYTTSYPVITEENALTAYVWDEELYQSDNTKGWIEV